MLQVDKLQYNSTGLITQRMLQVDILRHVTKALTDDVHRRRDQKCCSASGPHDRLSLIRSRAAAAIAEGPLIGGERKASEHAVEGALQG